MRPSVTLFGLARSVYTRIARLALEEKAVPYLLEEVEIFGPGGVPADHLKRHPFGRIPVLLHDAFSVYETHAICRYIDEAFPGPPLQPATPEARARMTQLIGLLDAYAYRPMVWGVFVQRVGIPLRGGVADEEVISKALGQARTALAAIASLAGESPFLAGPTLTLADLHAYPFLRYVALAPEGQAAIAEHPSLTRWLGSLSGRPSVRGTATEYERSAPAGEAS
ncbi:MAG: glutathione S-transferase family protein [Burkholderiales bacterium]|nr:glutathione S-transferase family protein [Burkholderiales bacterium]